MSFLSAIKNLSLLSYGERKKESGKCQSLQILCIERKQPLYRQIFRGQIVFLFWLFFFIASSIDYRLCSFIGNNRDKQIIDQLDFSIIRKGDILSFFNLL